MHYGDSMTKEILDYLSVITDEEKQILKEHEEIRKENYSSTREFIVDNRKLLSKGRFIEIRPHTRFAYFPKHRHNYVEMVYMCKGSTTHIINGEDKVVLNEGDLLFLNQHAIHEIMPAASTDLAVNFIILPEFFDKSLAMIEQDNVLRHFLISALTGEKSGVDFLYFKAKDILPIENLIENMLWTLIEKKTHTNTLVSVTMGLLLMNLSTFSEIPESGDDYEHVAVFKVLKYIESNYKFGTLSEISSELNLPDYTVSRLLKKYTGQNFKELLKQQKLQQAVYLLNNSSLSIDSIIENLGYNNSSFFYRSFKEKYGISPKVYRQNGPVNP